MHQTEAASPPVAEADPPSRPCANCAAALLPRFSYCPACGQSTEPNPESFGRVARDFLEDYLSFDSKVFRSLRPLLFNPGFLTNEYLQGRRVRYIAPLRMYLTVSLLAFLMLAVNKPGRTHTRGGGSASSIGAAQKEPAAGGAEEAGIESIFWDDFFESTLPKLFFILVPFYGLLQTLLYRRQRRFYTEHLVFSLHFHSFVFVGLLAYMLVSSYVSAGFVLFNRLCLGALAALSLLYLFVALKRVYGQTYAKTAVKFALLSAGYTATFVIFSWLALAWYYWLR